MDLSSQICLACATGFHWECPSREDNSCCCSESGPGFTTETIRSGPIKDDEDVTDPKSTGRKRAAVAYPIEEGMLCEWANLKAAGGGYYPIIGCHGRPAVARHHGPDKNTLNNNSGNVHRICANCHNRWHTRNDPLYDEFFGTAEWRSHDSSSIATVEEILRNEAYWLSKKGEDEQLDSNDDE